MASGTIKFKGVGDITNITLPFTAPTDGYFYVQINPNSSSTAYCYCIVNNSVRISAISISGIRATNGFPIKKGDVITLADTLNVKDYRFAFRHIYY